MLYPVEGPHTKTMLMAYIPRERLIISADVYEPGSHITHSPPTFSRRSRSAHLRVDRIAPLHMKVTPFEQLLKDAAVPVS